MNGTPVDYGQSPVKRCLRAALILLAIESSGQQFRLRRKIMPEKKEYAPPAIIFETHLETQAGSPPPNPEEVIFDEVQNE